MKVKKAEDEFDELFKDLNDVKKAVKRELEANNKEEFDEKDEEVILEEYLSEDEDDDFKENRENEEEEDFSLRIYFCSRTHSQLTQFVREVQKSPFASDVRLVSLASRANMCINQSVKSIKNVGLINEACLEMQKKKKAKKCAFYNASKIASVSDQSLLQVMDIEELTLPDYGTIGEHVFHLYVIRCSQRDALKQYLETLD